MPKLPPLTRYQEKVLESVADEYPDAKVIGWDTSVQGPLIEFVPGICCAISPRGRQVNRPDRS